MKSFKDCQSIEELEQSYRGQLAIIIEKVIENEDLFFNEKLRVIKGITEDAEAAMLMFN